MCDWRGEESEGVMGPLKTIWRRVKQMVDLLDQRFLLNRDEGKVDAGILNLKVKDCGDFCGSEIARSANHFNSVVL